MLDFIECSNFPESSVFTRVTENGVGGGAPSCDFVAISIEPGKRKSAPMCMTYYLGCECDAPLIEWSATSPEFHVSDPRVTDGEKVLVAVRKHLPFPTIRCLGSREGCGCGFRCNSEGSLNPIPADGAEGLKEAADEQADHEALAAYLQRLPKQNRPMQIYVCWSGDEEEGPENFYTCPISELASRDFAFVERGLVTLSG